jgi:hypothetical protein
LSSLNNDIGILMPPVAGQIATEANARCFPPPSIGESGFLVVTANYSK